MTDAVTSMEGAIRSAVQTMEQFFNPNLDNDKQIPITLLEQARGLAFMKVVKGGFIWTGKLGAGLVISKLQDGRWSAPSAIGTAGVGFGAELGGQVVDFMIILSSDAAVESFMQKGQFSAGANLEFAAGPYGRAAGANANISASGIAPNYTYSHSKGLFGGVGLQGSAIVCRSDLNKKFYGREISPTEILTGAVDQPAVAAPLYDAIDRAATMRESYTLNRRASNESIPPPAEGNDVEVVYKKVISMINTLAGEAAVNSFKTNCKDFGQDRMTSEAFIMYLRNDFTAEQLVQIFPDMVKLLPNQQKRNRIWAEYRNLKAEVLRSPSSGNSPSLF